ncbi:MULTISPECIES: hypothetical protein [unclassified Janthinobacterium]|uniref:hypothetical protein n=1 Tax=unclassified Janthinobacterium TaxID=2610881 RepID=UPI00161EC062|nr:MULTISPECIES: hypothetical protein [unclassified Janthinobacterium]MBB5370569.1 hypothetical protein [Janthinobacterium sp. K2C7]MBB5383217.1 hypothetical protein [Janthinobacterium sp. K2Li3]MBB5388671.1 hypothetical protein [Janthinobacterium sp. K2E3]
MYQMKSPRAAAMLAALLLTGAAGAALANAGAKVKKPAGLERYGVAVYSDLCVQKDSGEIGGQRVTLHRFAEADTVIYEFTAGSLSWPIVANDVNLDAATGALDFTIQAADGEERKLAGKFSKDGQTLTLEGDYCGGNVHMPMKLSRIRDFGRALKNCTPCPVAPAGPVEPENASAPVG